MQRKPVAAFKGAGTYAAMVGKVERSWLIWLSGLREPLLFFFDSFEQWQKHRDETFSDLANNKRLSTAEEIKELRADLAEAKTTIKELAKMVVDAEKLLRSKGVIDE